MKIKSISLFIVILSFSGTAYSQFTQTWNSNDKLNSATAGFLYEKEANLSFKAYPRNGYLNGIAFANYSTLTKNKKFGIGVNYMNSNFGIYDTKLSHNSAKLNLNRQFSTKNGNRFSIGTGIGGTISTLKRDVVGMNGHYVENNNLMISDISAAYATKRFNIGISVQSVFDAEYFGLGASLFSSYTFGDLEKLQFTVYGSLNTRRGATIAGLFTYKSKFKFGAGITDSFRPMGFLTVGYVINDKVSINYSFDFDLTKNNFSNFGSRHEIGVAFQLGKR